MSKGSSSPPPAPDYAGAAQATAQGNQDALSLQTELNRVNQSGPWGSTTYTQPYAQFDEDGYNSAVQRYRDMEAALDENPNGGQMRQYLAAIGQTPKMPSRSDYMSGSQQWEQTTTLDPRLQSMLDGQLEIGQGRTDIANSLLDRLKESYAKPFEAPNRADYTANIPGVNFGSNDRAGTFSSDATINTNSGSYLGNVGNVNQNVAQFDPAAADLYATKAYEGQMALLRPDMEKQDATIRNGLALQGLTPGSEASTKALTGYETAKAAQLNSLAANSYLTGAQTAQSNYNTYLGGVKAGNEAQGQAFDQGISRFNTDNQAQAAKYLQDQSTYGTNLQGLTTNAQLTGAQNQAQQQAYAQALSDYATDWQQAQTLRNMPLNEVNALLNGQQVQNPTFPSVNGAAGATTGADYLGALTQQANYNQGVYNADQARSTANTTATTGALAALASAAIMASDKRLKKNIEKVGETPGGRNVYTWDWNEKAGSYLGPRIGVLAQENTDAAVPMRGGYLAVDYSKIH